MNKPFLRWAGGKSWLIKYFPELFPNLRFNNYHEPFLGSGAVYFSIGTKSTSYLSDTNTDLIVTYKALRENPHRIIKYLREYKNDEEFYYTIRDSIFTNPYEKAAKFIYLNQTSFNGIYRVNLKGIYNVPYGFRSKNFLDEEVLYQSSKLLSNAIILDSDFDIIKENLKKNDLVFLDPPYTVSHNNNGFIKYNEKLFSISDQYRLSNLIDTIKKKEALYILTNAAHKTVKEIFEKNDQIFEINRASLVGGMNANRGKVTEYIFTNIERG